MESVEQLSCNNLEVMDIEKDSVNNSLINVDRNKIEAIPKTNQVLMHFISKIIIKTMCKCLYTFYSLKNCKI